MFQEKLSINDKSTE